MLGVTLFGLFLTPIFYVAMRKLSREPLARAQEDETQPLTIHR
jgi:hypothetical protein